MNNRSTNINLWSARILIGTVLIVNLQCAILFIWRPEVYSFGFELSGAAGAAAVRGIGVLFLMWNVPYALATYHPKAYRISLFEAIAMQTIGLMGESLILWSLTAAHATARWTIARFIVFDATGLVLLCIAAWITREYYHPILKSTS